MTNTNIQTETVMRDGEKMNGSSDRGGVLKNGSGRGLILLS